MYEEYGVKSSLYCYYHNGTFSLVKFLGKYLMKFSENRDVSKSEDLRTYYNSYIHMIEEFIRICGNHTKSIDFFET